MSVDSEITIVSGLPRSGTSLMMQMLDQGGFPVLTDQIRAADPDNPNGYLEYEPVKNTRDDRSWLADARGKVVKLVSPLLYDLPATENYRVIFMERDLDEVLASQEKMLHRLNRPAVPTEIMRESFLLHLDRIFAWLHDQPNMQTLKISYHQLLLDADACVRQICDFLDNRPVPAKMLAAIDRSLYRNRLAKDDRKGV